jgi:hypothetical protein
MSLLAVQFSTARHPASGRGAVWSLAVFTLGVVLVAAGGGASLRRRWWRAHAASALGRIVDQVSHPGRHRVAAPVIQFEAGDRRITFCASSSRSGPRLSVGEAAGVLYDPTDPRRATLADADTRWSWSVVAGLAVLGVFTAVVVG